MHINELNQWFPAERRATIIERLMSSQVIGMTPKRATCLVRLSIYLCIKQRRTSQPSVTPPLLKIETPDVFTTCTHREACDLFYSDQPRGSERAAGLMLKRLDMLGFIKYRSTGNASQVLVQPLLQLSDGSQEASLPELQADAFDPRSDAIPIAALLAQNYNWMNHNTRSVPQRIANLLRNWANQYPKGMRVLRRVDNQNPVGFYLLFPIVKESESVLELAPNSGLHLGSLNEVDPFSMAQPGDPLCRSIFVRSWIIQEPYQQRYLLPFLSDVQDTLKVLREDFPSLCDIWTLIIHPSYAELAAKVGFQRFSQKTGKNIYWMYLSFDRFLALDLKNQLDTEPPQ